MRKLLVLSALAAILWGCGNSSNGELVGVQDRPKFYQPDPYGMVYIPMGSYTMGIGGEDVPKANLRDPKTVTVTAFYMDETEITNNEYRQFVHWVRDSIAMRMLVQANPDQFSRFIMQPQGPNAVPLPPSQAPLNWDERIEYEDEKVAEVLEQQTNFFIPKNQRFYRKREVNAKMLNYEYFWIDLRKAATKNYSQKANPEEGMFGNRTTQRQNLVKKDQLNIYPDTLCWIHDFTYTHNDPIVKRYFWHPAYDHYPIVGVNWKQARAFNIDRKNVV